MMTYITLDKGILTCQADSICSRISIDRLRLRHAIVIVVPLLAAWTLRDSQHYSQRDRSKQLTISLSTA